jgi:hypothetical protein
LGGAQFCLRVKMDDSQDMEFPLVEKDGYQNAKQAFVPDNFAVQAVKRLFSISPLLAMCFSTINQVITVTESITSQSENRSYSSYVQVESDGVYSGYTCEYGDAKAAIIYCPYTPVPAFKAVMSMWVSYFVVFMAYRLYATLRYSTDDMRFYIAVDKLNGQLFNKIMVGIGAILTLISVAIGIFYLSPQTEWNQTVDSASVTDLVVFFGINFVALRGFRKQFITSHSGKKGDPSDASMEDFTEPVPIHSKGMFASVSAVVQPITVSYMLHLVRRDGDALLRQHGEPAQLIDAMGKLYK